MGSGELLRNGVWRAERKIICIGKVSGEKGGGASLTVYLNLADWGGRSICEEKRRWEDWVVKKACHCKVTFPAYPQPVG